jgi:oxygen-independent coproporphyrinogen-3 oxidase
MKCAEDLRQWGTRWINTANPKLYLEKISKLGRACEHQEVLSKQQAMAEFIFTGLRKKDGFLLSDFSKLFGEDLTRELREKLGQHQDLDLLIIDEHRVSFSEKGFLFSDYIFADLVI